MKQTPVFIVLVCLLLFISCKSTTGPDNGTTPNNGADNTPQTIQAGEWTTTTTFGTLDFMVGSSSDSITKITITYSSWKGRSGSVSVSKDPAWAINNRGFSINTTIMSEPWTFVGTFDDSGIKASGTWSVTISGSTESGAWEAAPKT